MISPFSISYIIFYITNGILILIQISINSKVLLLYYTVLVSHGDQFPHAL